MSEKELQSAGYHTYRPNQDLGDRWTIAYQKRFWIERRTRYFIDVRVWHHGDGLIGYEATLNVNNGCRFFPLPAPVKITFWHIHDWTVDQLEAAAKEFHDRLETVDYDAREHGEEFD